MKRFFLLATLILATVLGAHAQTLSVRSYMSFVGTYSASLTYAKGDVVSYGGVTYVSTTIGNVGNTPSSSPTQWANVSAASTGNGISFGNQYDVQLAGSSGAFSSQVGILRSDAEGNGNLYTGALENDVFDPSWNHYLSGHYITFRGDQDAYTVYANGAHSAGIPQVRGSWYNYEFSGIGHIWTYSRNIGASTQIGHEADYTSYMAGQNIGSTGNLNFFGDGDNISSEHQMLSGGNTGQANMEGTHGDWLDIYSQGNATNNCLGGCGQVGSSVIYAGYPTGQGNIIADRSDNLSGSIVGFVSAAGNSQPFAEVQVSGFSLGASSRYQINEAMTVDQHVASTPGPCCGTFVNTPWATASVDVSINTSPVYAGALTSTSSVPTTGYGCLVNPPPSTGLSSEIVSQEMYERVAYTVKDSTHFTLYPVKTHSANSEFFIGGACGYGIEQHAQTNYQNAITVYPIAGSLDSSHLVYVGDAGMILGSPGAHGFENASCPVTSIARSGPTNTITLGSCSGVVGSLNQQTVTISGITADSSFNAANVTLTATASGAWTYPASSSGTVATTSVSAGTLAAGDTSAYIYPIAEVLLPHNPTKERDNNVVGTSPYYFPSSNAVTTRSLPYYSQFNGDLVQVRPYEDTFLGTIGHRVLLQGGAARGPTGSGQYGYEAQNSEPMKSYQGAGGTYTPPNAAYFSTGQWQTGLTMFNPPMGGAAASVFVNDTGAWYPAGTITPSYNIFLSGTGLGISVVRGLEGQNTPESRFMTLFGGNITIGSRLRGITTYTDSLAGPHGVLGETVNNGYTTISPQGDHSNVPTLTLNKDTGGRNIPLQANGTIQATDVAVASSTLSSGTSCGSHPANSIWADDSYLYHCNSTGTAAMRVALSSF